MFVYIYVLCLRSDWLDRGLIIYICEKSLEMCICLWPEFDCPEVTLCGLQDIKIQLLLLLPFFFSSFFFFFFFPFSFPLPLRFQTQCFVSLPLQTVVLAVFSLFLFLVSYTFVDRFSRFCFSFAFAARLCATCTDTDKWAAWSGWVHTENTLATCM